MISEESFIKLKLKIESDFLKFKQKIESLDIKVYEDKPFYNIVFEKDNEKYRISQYQIYRISGPCVIYVPLKDDKGEEFKILDNTLFYNIITGLVKNFFNL